MAGNGTRPVTEDKPETVELTEVEAIRFENLTLKAQIVGNMQQELEDEKADWVDSVTQRTGFDLDGYQVDAKARICRRTEK